MMINGGEQPQSERGYSKLAVYLCICVWNKRVVKTTMGRLSPLRPPGVPIGMIIYSLAMKLKCTCMHAL